MLKLPVARLGELFSRIDDERALYLPLEANGQVSFGRWSQETSPRLDHLISARPVKDYFFPQTENLALFQRKGKELRIEESRDPGEAFALFGVRACDAESMTILDMVFLSDPADTFYQAKRENGVLITVACSMPEETCFCTAYGIDPATPAGDISAWLTQDGLYWISNTEKGEALTASLNGLFEDAGAPGQEAVQTQKDAIGAVMARLPLRDLSVAGFTGEGLMEIFDADQWKSLYEACLGCGSCTFVCPTCHCYDIQDFDTGNGVRRFRCWDSCMYSDFTLMSHGNPRYSQLERFRQRFMHKLVYFPANYEGQHACVGCGRCIVKCPVYMHIAKVIKTLGVETHVR